MFRSEVKAVGLVVAGLSLMLLSGYVFASQESRYFSKYQNPSFYGGLFYVSTTPDKYDNRALVLSFDDKPIDPKPNDPDAPTAPGFYLSYTERFPFQRVEVIGKRVYFKTQRIGGRSYTFIGIAGKRRFNNFDPSILVPYIKGTLVELKDGKVVGRERLKFHHALIA